MSQVFTNQQGGVFDAEVFDETVFDVGTVWRRTEPDPGGWVRAAEPDAGYGGGPYGGTLYGGGANWTRTDPTGTAWVRAD